MFTASAECANAIDWTWMLRDRHGWSIKQACSAQAVEINDTQLVEIKGPTNATSR